jgi:DNA-binding NarL/FixJ family response regulator
MSEKEGSAITVFIVAGSAIIRAGLTALVEADGRFIVVGSTAEISTALPDDSFQTQTADVLLLDIENQNEDWFEVLPQLSGLPEESREYPAIVALVPDLTDSEWLTEMVRRNMRGILGRDANENEIAAAIEAAASGLVALSPLIVETILQLLANNRSLPLFNAGDDLPEELIETLTPREQEVLEMLAEGASNKTIAHRLSISEHTVKFHVSSIFGKLNVTTRTEAVTQGLKMGLLLL